MTPIPATIPGNGWHHYNDSDTVFVFVHGFLSDSAGCWSYQEPQNTGKPIFWPDMVLSDHRLGAPSIYLGGYYTCRTSRDYAIADCATELFDALQREDTERRPPPFSKNKIIFICHSLGGIVTRYMLAENYECFASKHIGLILLASPSLGSGIANFAQRFLSGYGNAILKQLQHEAPLLSELDRKFTSLTRDRKLPNLVGAEAYENQPIVPIWPLSKIIGKVVEKNSAGRYFESKNMPGTNHGSIAKPSSINHPTHIFLVDFYTRKFIRADSPPPPIKASVDHGSAAGNTNQERHQDKHNERSVLFTRYSPEYEPYFLTRPLDKKVGVLINISGLWISGPSGVGKTCSVTRAVHQTNAKYLYINLANCMGGTIDRMFVEILVNIKTHFQDSPHESPPFDLTSTIAKIATTLDANLSHDYFHVFIEEIPIDDTPSFSSFIQAAISLLISCAATPNGSRVRFLFSSIASPKEHIPLNQNKIHETIKFLEFNEWNDGEVYHLIEHLCQFLGYEIDDEFTTEIVKYARGSPRFVKTFLLNYHVASKCGRPTSQALLAETSRELGQ